MIKRIISAMVVLGLLLGCVSLTSCGKSSKNVKIGVSLGVGEAIRWQLEKTYMENRAKELDVSIEVRLNKGDGDKTQYEDCVEMIDGGIDVLILTPRDASKAKDIVEYAKSKNVPIVNYARAILEEDVDILVGYDCYRIGQKMGQHLTEIVYSGDYLILRGDASDYNAVLIHDGAMKYIDTIKNDINIILDEAVPNWSPEEAKAMVKEAVSKNNNSIDAILAPNDKLAGACAEALSELGIEKDVAITGMDAEIDALKRIVDGKQSMTFYMDLNQLSTIAVDQAYNLAIGEPIEVNAEYDNQGDKPMQANLITGQVVIKQNMDKVLIENGYFTREQIYDIAS